MHVFVVVFLLIFAQDDWSNVRRAAAAICCRLPTARWGRCCDGRRGVLIYEIGQVLVVGMQSKAGAAGRGGADHSDFTGVAAAATNPRRGFKACNTSGGTARLVLLSLVIERCVVSSHHVCNTFTLA